MEKPYWYEIRVEGHLTDRWSEWFDGLEIHNDPDGETTLTGQIRDQAALIGILNKAQALNLVLIAIKRIPGEAIKS